MRKLFMLMVAALALTGWSFAQDQDNAAQPQDQDNTAKQDMKKAGHDVKDAAKATGRGVKKGAKATKDKIADRDDKDKDRVPQSDRDADHDRAADTDRVRDADRDRDASGNRSNSTAARDEAAERTVHITNGPNINPSSNSASINWNTNKNAATDVWLMGPGIRGHRVQYDRGGSTNHNVSFSNLRPHTTYTYEIRTREGGDRKQGTFTTP
jgi:hypothetical protein